MYQNKIKNAFTILELSVVVVIIAVLVFTTINYSNTMSVNAKNRITKDKLKISLLEKETPIKFMVFDILASNSKTIIQIITPRD